MSLHNVCRRHPQDVGRGRPMALHMYGYGDVPYVWVRGRPQDVTLECLQDVIFQCPKDVGRELPQDAGRGRRLALNRGPYRRAQDVILPRVC